MSLRTLAFALTRSGSPPFLFGPRARPPWPSASPRPPTIRAARLSLGSGSFGPVLRLRTGPGFGPTIGFDWFSIFVDMQAGDRKVYVGEMRVRPVMGGIAYTVFREPVRDRLLP